MYKINVDVKTLKATCKDMLAYKVDGENIPINLVLTSLNSNSNVY